MNREPFVEGEYYHIYNQGVDKRDITVDEYDLDRLLQSLVEFNTEEPIGSILENSFGKEKRKAKRLADILCYCINPNHLHMLVKARSDKGISNFMQKFFTGYTNYFNEKYDRRGSLFQGTFKSKHVADNDYLLHVSAYVNLNNRVHQLGSLTPKLRKRSSWDYYLTGKETVPGLLSGQEIISGQFKNFSEYKKFAEESLEFMLERKKIEKELKKDLLEE